MPKRGATRSRNLRIPSKMDPPGWTLTPEHAMFVSLYLGDCKSNAREACRRLGYTDPHKSAEKILRNPGVRAAIAARLDKMAMTVDEVLYRQTEVARADMDDFFTMDPKTHRLRFDYLKAKKLGKTHLIKKIKFNLYGVEIELHDSQAAQERLMRHHGAFNDHLNVIHSIDWDNVPMELLEAFQRGEISVDQLPRVSQPSLSHSPSEPLTIDGVGMIHETVGKETD